MSTPGNSRKTGSKKSPASTTTTTSSPSTPKTDPSMPLDLATAVSERDSLRSELDRIQEELAVTAREKTQSAEYGLQLLDQKDELQKRFDELESMYDTTRSELEVLRTALAKSQTSQKVSAVTGIEQEESLLQESATKEANFASTLSDLERELKSVRSELDRVREEKERLVTEHQDISKQLEVCDWERKNMRTELKDLKMRETRLLQEMNELEDENISLQKQVSNLKSSQIEFETAKHEVIRLQEELELRRLQVEEFETLKNIAEKQMKEALEALESEREQKYELKKKLDEKISSESVLNMSNFGLRFSGLGSKNKHLMSGSKIAKLARVSLRHKQQSSSPSFVAATASEARDISQGKQKQQQLSARSTNHDHSQNQGSRISTRHHSTASSSCFTIAFPAASASTSATGISPCSATSAAVASAPSFCSSSSSVNSSLSSVSSTIIQNHASACTNYYNAITGSNRYSYTASNSSFSNPSLSPDITLTLTTPGDGNTPVPEPVIDGENMPIDASSLPVTAVVAPTCHSSSHESGMNSDVILTNFANNYKSYLNNNVISAQVKNRFTETGKQGITPLSEKRITLFPYRFLRRSSDEASDKTHTIFSQSQQHFTTASDQINNTYNQSFHVSHNKSNIRTRPQSLSIECHETQSERSGKNDEKERCISIIPCSNRKIIDHQSILLQLCKSMHVISTTTANSAGESVGQLDECDTLTPSAKLSVSGMTTASLSELPSPDDSITTVRSSPDSVIRSTACVEKQPQSSHSPLRKSPAIDYDEIDRIDSLEWDEPVILKKITSLPTEEALVRHCQTVIADTHCSAICRSEANVNVCGLHHNPCITCLKFTLRVLTGCCLGVFAP